MRRVLGAIAAYPDRADLFRNYPELEDEAWQPPAGPEADPERTALGIERGRVLQAALEPAWSQALHDAWVEAYTLVVSIMRRAGDRISGEFAPGLPPAP